MLETIEMRCAPTRIGTSSWDLAYEGRARDGGRLVVEGVSTQVQYDYATRAKAPIPAAWRALLTADLELA
jgi:acyl-CoA thioesterase FadM